MLLILFLFFFFFFALPNVLYGELLQVQIVHRHGVRGHLRKHEIHPGQENGATLLPAGREQLITLGKLIRKRYLENPAVGWLPTYTGPLDILSTSSNLDRTLTSSRSFLSGLYPQTNAYIPTKVFNSKENDYRLRGYTFCAEQAYILRDSFYETKEFTRKSEESKKFLEYISKPINERAVLRNVWNIFDIYHLASLNISSIDGVARLPDDDYARLKALADWVETSKYSATHIPGVPLLATMLNYSLEISGDNNNNDPRMRHRIIEYSAHYPTILSLFAATQHYEMKTIPPFGSALVWETHRDVRTKAVFIRPFWYPGGNTTTSTGQVLQPIQLFPKMDLKSILARRLKETTLGDITPGPRYFCMHCGTNPALHPICAPNVLPATVADNTTTSGIGNSPWLFGSKHDVCAIPRRQGILFGTIIGIVFILAALGVSRCFRNRFHINSSRLRDPDLDIHHRPTTNTNNTSTTPGIAAELEDRENRPPSNWAPDDWSPKHDYFPDPPARARSGPSFE